MGRRCGPTFLRCAFQRQGDGGEARGADGRAGSGGRAAVSGSASGCSPHSLAPAGKRSGAGCETLRALPQ